MEYALRLSDAEVDRYRAMAAMARAGEADLWERAGIRAGARVVDVGCGPGAILLELADVVGTGGSVVGVDGDEQAVSTARALLDAAGYGDADVVVGKADDTGLPAGSFDVAVMRHVLAHNGPREQAIVDHLATLVRPGGRVYLVDVDVDGMTLGFEPADADIDDLGNRYRAFHLGRGNDLRTGTRLAQLLASAGLEVVADQRVEEAFAPPPGVRPPPFAAAEAMIADGLADAADIERWRAAFDRVDASPIRPTVTVVRHSAIGRRPS
jgi:2-polyprenyl-3-methyl-5-hydroxy-6-metoxy-1,4-benzoquinol methylase